MFKFPIKKTVSSSSYAKGYFNKLSEVSKKINYEKIEELANLILNHYLSNKNILSRKIHEQVVVPSLFVDLRIVFMLFLIYLDAQESIAYKFT